MMMMMMIEISTDNPTIIDNSDLQRLSASECNSDRQNQKNKIITSETVTDSVKVPTENRRFSIKASLQIIVVN